MSNTRSLPERAWPRQDADDEQTLQWEFLDFLRATAVGKATGLDRAAAAATPLATSPLMSILGVLKHLTAVERYWLSIIGGGRDLPLLWDPDDATAEWHLTDADTPDTVTAAYAAEWARSRDALAGLAPGDRTRRDSGDQPRTVRWVLAHLAQETARHVGHLDILRELADGTVGE